jgi:GNAT superfamily N-acetyltransferase
MTARELLPPETRLAHAAMSGLRPEYLDENLFVDQVDSVQRPEGYRLVGVFAHGTKQAVAVAGFRMGHSLGWGHYLYVDDVTTLQDHRRRGHAGALLDWILADAQRLGCGQVHLDSGTGPERVDAHRLYFKQGFVISSHHFARRVPRA